MAKTNLHFTHLFQPVLITQDVIGILGTFRKFDGRGDESVYLI